MAAKSPFSQAAASTSDVLKSRLTDAEVAEQTSKAKQLFERYFRESEFTPELGSCDF
jgi:hypothetical protein